MIIISHGVGYARKPGLDWEGLAFGIPPLDPHDPSSLEDAFEVGRLMTGADTYAVSSPHRGTAYAAIEWWTSAEDSFTVALTADASEELGWPRIIQLYAPVEQLATVIPHVTEITGIRASPSAVSE